MKWKKITRNDMKWQMMKCNAAKWLGISSLFSWWLTLKELVIPHLMARKWSIQVSHLWFFLPGLHFTFNLNIKKSSTKSIRWLRRIKIEKKLHDIAQIDMKSYIALWDRSSQLSSGVSFILYWNCDTFQLLLC